MSQFFSNGNNSFNTFNTLARFDDESKLLAWLSPLEPWVRHRDIGTQRIDSVGDWVLETEEFRRWHNGSTEDESDHAILFCHGNPGVGKSYITSLVIDKLCDEVEGNTVVVCFYFDFAARSEQSPTNVLGTLLRQIVSALDEIPEVVVQAFRKQKKVIGGKGLQVSGILKMFQNITATKRTFICVDALDECVLEYRTVILESLGQILHGSPNTRIFMTGRPYVRSEVEQKLEGAATFLLIQPTEDGLIRYLREKLRNDTVRGPISATLEDDIMRIIPEISSETFLLASLHIEAILRETTIARRGKRLESVGDGVGLGDAYGMTLERIKSQDREKAGLAVATLMWICHSERPLQVDELCHALAVEIGATDFDPENAPSIGALLGCCQGLITIDKEASTVRLIHFTVQKYLCTHPDLFYEPHSIIAETCLTYLNSQQIGDLSTRPLPDHQSVPFLKYSSRYWGTHANMQLSNHARTLALELLSQYEDHASAVSLLKQVHYPVYIGEIVSSSLFSGLHCAAFFGIVELVAALVDAEGCEINRQDCTGSTPLSLAAVYGHEGVVKLLLGRGGLNSSKPNRYGQTPLFGASQDGHENVVKMLLEREDIDPNKPDNRGQTPLYRAAWNGHEGVVKILLGQGDTNPDKPDVYGQTPLFGAAMNGCEGVVKILLERDDVNPGKANRHGQTPLFGAVWDGHEGVVRILLGRDDVNPHRPDSFGRTALWWAAKSGHAGVVGLLQHPASATPSTV